MKGFLIVLTIIALSRFYNLSWGGSYFFHPDERNIASAVSQLRFPHQMNPHFFAYGSFPIYLTYFTTALLNAGWDVSFSQAILVGRIYSALLSLLLIVTAFFIGKKLKDSKTGLLASFLFATSIGLAQFAHFATFEVWLLFLAVLLFYSCLHLAQEQNMKNAIGVGIVLGLLLATKVSSVVLLPLPLFLFVFSKNLGLRGLAKTLIFLLVSLATFLAFSPYALIDAPSFLASLQYEGSVALGTFPVFYTSSFYETVPVLFQFTKIYPFLLNPLIALIFVPSMMYVVYITIKQRIVRYYLLFTIYYLLFLPQAFFFAKWTRYMVPTLPFVYLTLALAIAHVPTTLRKTAVVLTTLTSLTFLFSFLITAYAKQDTRIQAAIWAKDRIPINARIISEVYDIGITAFNPSFPNITLFNFYELDGNTQSQKQTELSLLLQNADYIVLPSQRIMKSRLNNPKRFPQGHVFYRKLFSAELGFTKVYQTPCDVFCKMTYLGDPVFALEETASVFDRPTVFIFKKL